MTNSKLKEWQVLEIRRKYKEDDITRKALAKEFDIAESTLGYILDNSTWRHLL